MLFPFQHQWSETLGFLAFNQQPENLVPNMTSEGTSEGCF
jgi:hypothetical protein